MSTKTVLIVDDSALMRKLLSDIFTNSGKLEVLGAAPDPYVARQMIKDLNPDVITLDIEMPRMDGLMFLSKIMSLRPTPVVMISSLTQNSADATLKALELGAVDYVGKPTQSLSENLSNMADEIVDKVYAAARARVRKVVQATKGPANVTFATTEQVIAIGASTGGVTAISDILTALPSNAPAIVMAQHMPPSFTGSFAQRLDGRTAIKVVEAQHGQRLLPGHAYLAPGDRHLRVKRSGGNYISELFDGPKVSGHRPSVDVLFDSMASTVGQRGIGVILTGMGRDGAEGLLKMRETGAHTIGQDRTTATVYGMCGAAYDIGAVERQLKLPAIADAILEACEDILKVRARH